MNRISYENRSDQIKDLSSYFHVQAIGLFQDLYIEVNAFQSKNKGSLILSSKNQRIDLVLSIVYVWNDLSHTHTHTHT
jgi:hypothetical protein